MNIWDRTYAIEGYRYGVAPNAFLVEQAHRFPANASIIAPGDGEGRNGVWLARQGHDVLSMDASRVGLEKARSLAGSQGVPVRTEVADLATWAPEPQSADAVVLIHVPLPSGIRQSAHRRMATALRPGGVLVVPTGRGFNLYKVIRKS